MQKSAIGLAILLFLAVAGLLLAPYFVDLNRLKGPIAAALTERTGHPVELVGPIGLSLLPAPTITARDLRMANPPGTAIKDMVRLRAAEVKLALWPLVTGHVELRSAMLIEPEIDLERLPGGGANWQAEPKSPAGDASPAAGSSGGAPPLALAVDRLTIQNGAITYRSGAMVERFEHINASGTLDRIAGSVAASGNFVARGAALSFTVQTGPLDASELPLQLTVTTKPEARLQLDALVTGSGDDRRLDGKLKLAADDGQAVLATLARLPAPGLLAQPVALAADVGGSLRAATLDHLTLDVGPAHAEGRVQIDPGAPLGIRATLRLPRLDLDHWPAPRKLAALRPSPSAAFAAASDAVPALAPAQRGRGVAFALPEGVAASLELGVEAVVWHGDVVREMRLKMSLANGRIALDRFAALLPGGSDLSLSANGAMTPDGPRAEGVIEANADDLRSLLGWGGLDAGGVPADRLRKASVSSRFTVEGDRLELANIDATLDSTRLTGAATILMRDRPGIGLRLAADRFNLDAYLPKAASSTPAAGAAATAAAAPEHPGEERGALAAADANVDARVEALTWHGQPLGDVHLAGTLENGEVTVRELSVGDAVGASGTLSGVIEGLGRDAPKGQLAFDMKGPELERVLRLVSPLLATGRSYGAFSVGGGLQSDGETLTIDTDAQVLDGHAHVTGDIAPASGKLDLDLDLDHPSFSRLLGGFFPTYRPAGGDPGPVKLAGHLAGDVQHVSVERLALAVGDSKLEGTLGIDPTSPRPHIAADLTIGDWAIDRLLGARQSALMEEGVRHAALMPNVILAQAGATAPPRNAAWSREPIDWSWLGLADLDLKLTGHGLSWGMWHLGGPALTLSDKDGVVTLDQLDATLFGGRIAASGAIDGGAAPSMRSHVALKGGDLKAALAASAGLRLMDGRFDLDATLSSAGASAADLIGHLAGDVALSGSNGSLSGVDLKAMNEQLAQPGKAQDLLGLLRSGAGGRTAFSALTGAFHIADGVARSDDIKLDAEGGAGQASATIDLPRWSLSSRVAFQLTGAANAPPLVMRLDGPLDAPRVVFDVNALEQFLAQRAPAKPTTAQP